MTDEIDGPMGKETTRECFRLTVEAAINCHSAENGSNTPDFILAEYLIGCLEAYDKATLRRENWYGRGEEGPCP